MTGVATRGLLLAVIPALLASGVVLATSGVSRAVWLVQAASVALMFALAMLVSRTPFFVTPAGLVASAVAGVAVCAVPLAGGATGPQRWIATGPLSIYVAPVVVPVLLALTLAALRRRARWRTAALAVWCALLLVLAAQPDVSQVLAAGAALVVMAGIIDDRWLTRALWAAAVLFAAGVAAWRPDPLQPVPHVELVFAVAWGHSALAGVVVTAAVIAWLGALTSRVTRLDAALAAIPVYYAVLFACSVRGLTPAPLVGYGAGPLLGYGLMAGLVTRISAVPAPPSPDATALPVGARPSSR